MKNLLILTLVLSSATLFAQTNRTNGNASAVSSNMVVAANSNNAFGAATVFFNPERKADGSVHLFKGWNNTGVILTTDNQKFSIKNVNLNLERNVFESKIGQDSLFTFNFNNIERFLVNGKIFKNYYYDGENRVFQETYNGGNFQILKGYKVTLVKGSANPMLNRSTDKYIQKEFYYIRQNDLISPFKLKKKSLMKLVDQSEAKKIIAYVKKQ